MWWVKAKPHGRDGIRVLCKVIFDISTSIGWCSQSMWCIAVQLIPLWRVCGISLLLENAPLGVRAAPWLLPFPWSLHERSSRSLCAEGDRLVPGLWGSWNRRNPHVGLHTKTWAVNCLVGPGVKPSSVLFNREKQFFICSPVFWFSLPFSPT